MYIHTHLKKRFAVCNGRELIPIGCYYHQGGLVIRGMKADGSFVSFGKSFFVEKKNLIYHASPVTLKVYKELFAHLRPESSASKASKNKNRGQGLNNPFTNNTSF